MVDSQAIPWRVEGRVTFPLLMAVTEEVNPEKMMTGEREREREEAKRSDLLPAEKEGGE